MLLVRRYNYPLKQVGEGIYQFNKKNKQPLKEWEHRKVSHYSKVKTLRKGKSHWRTAWYYQLLFNNMTFPICIGEKMLRTWVEILCRSDNLSRLSPNFKTDRGNPEAQRLCNASMNIQEPRRDVQNMSPIMCVLHVWWK